jgi:hypothetical protein
MPYWSGRLVQPLKGIDESYDSRIGNETVAW